MAGKTPTTLRIHCTRIGIVRRELRRMTLAERPTCWALALMKGSRLSTKGSTGQARLDLGWEHCALGALWATTRGSEGEGVGARERGSERANSDHRPPRPDRVFLAATATARTWEPALPLLLLVRAVCCVLCAVYCILCAVYSVPRIRGLCGCCRACPV